MITENLNHKLIFSLLGPPMVMSEDQVLDIPRRQVRTLLYLLGTDDRPLPYQTLHFLFWSDKPEKECRRNLSHLFTHLRNCLPNQNILLQNSVSAWLDPNLFQSDVLEFKSLSNRPYTENFFAHLIQANQLYQGPYLEGKYLPGSAELEKYVEQIRLDLEARYLKNLSDLLQIYKKLKKTSEAIECAEAYLSLDHYNEDIFNELLILHSYLGNNGRIIHLYNHFSKKLQDQLNIKPSPKTRTIFEQIVAASRRNQNPSIAHKINTLDYNAPFVQYQLSNLQTLQKYTTSQNGSGGIVLIAGEVGMGKSELITNYIAHAPPNLVNFRIICTPATQKIRIYPFRELSKKLLSTDHHNKLNANILSQHFKEIILQLSKPAQINSAATNELIHFIFERDYSLIQDLFEELAKLPLTLNIIIENIEWADADSLEMILLLLEKPRINQSNFICSFCCKKENRLKIFIQDVQLSQAYLGTLRMEYLTYEDILNLLQKQFGLFDDSHRLAKQLLQVTNGNPFYISGILQEMHQNKLTHKQLSSIKTFEIPKIITQKFNSKFERLSSNEKSFLQYAAVKNSPICFEEITELLNLSSHEALEVVNDLICQNLIDHEGNAFFIKNKIIQKSIQDHLTQAQKQIIQNSLDQLLKKSPK